MAPAQNPNQPDYSSDAWSDITPIPLDEGPGSGPTLASIAYTPRYSTAMSYLRAVMASNEFSHRALALTADIISMNPAHYTVWLYRAKIIAKMGEDVLEELKWLEGVAVKSLKNYQIWHHRRLLMSTLSRPPPTEASFLSHILSLDSKNYHVWTYRQWLVSHYDLFDSPQEMQAVEQLLDADVRNNSAWNHRWFLCFGREDKEREKQKQKARRLEKPANQSATTTEIIQVTDLDLIGHEVDYAQKAILLAPQNQSPWNYLRALYRRSGRPVSELRPFADGFTGPDGDVDEGVRSSHALELLAEIYGEQSRQAERGDESEDGGVGGGKKTEEAESISDAEKAKKLLRVLGTKWDPIRKGYWDYRIGLLAGLT